MAVHTPAQAVAHVVSVKGEAYARAADGSLRQLKAGDQLYVGETLVTHSGSQVVLAFKDGHQMMVLPNEAFQLTPDVTYEFHAQPADAAIGTAEVNSIIQAIERGGNINDVLASPAAGINGPQDSGNDFVRLLRISEGVSGLEYQYSAESAEIQQPHGPAVINQAPVANPDAQTLGEDTPSVTGNVISGANSNLLTSADSDPEHGVLSVTGVALGILVPTSPVSVGTVIAGTWGDLVLNADGSYTYTPNYHAQSLGNGQTVVEQFTYTIQDPAGASATTTLTLTVTGSNDTPVVGTIPNGANPPQIDPNLDPATGHYLHTIPEDTSVSGQVTATDPENDALVYTQASNPAHGTVSVNPDGSYTYTPNANYNGNDSFDVLVDDGHGGTAIAVVDIVITPVQDPSIIAPGQGQVTEDTVLVTSGHLAISDVDGPQDEHFTPQANTAGAHGTFSIDANGNWVYHLNNSDPAVQDLNQGDTLTEVFTVTGVDGTPSTVTVVINGVNENAPPSAQNDSASTNQDAPVTINVLGNDSDPDGDSLSIGGFGQGAHGTVTLVGGQLVYTPNPGFVGTDTFTYSVSDGKGGTDTATVTVDVAAAPVNQPPVAVDDSSTGNTTNNPVTVNVLGNDSDLDGTLNPAAVQIVGTANPGDPLVVAGQGTWSVNSATGAITFTPEAGYTGSPTPVQYTVQDNDGNISNQATVTVGYGAQPPVAMGDSVTGSADHSPVTVNVLGNDSDPDGTLVPASVQIVGTAHAGDPLMVAGQGTWTVDSATGAITFTPEVGFTSNPAPIQYTVQDNDGNVSNPAAVNISYFGAPTITVPDQTPSDAGTDLVLPETAGPTAENFTVTAPAGLASITVDGTTFTLAQLGTPAYLAAHPITTPDGTLTLTGYDAGTGQVSYSYDPDVLSHTGSAPIIDPISLTVTDANGITGTGQINIGITDSLPVAVDDAASITEDASPNTVTGNVLTDAPGTDTVGADVNPSPITPATVTLAHGDLALNADGSYAYTLNNADPAVNALNDGETLIDSYAYTLTDGDGSSSTAVLTITIDGVNDAPVAVDDSATTAEDTPLTVAVGSGLLSNDTDLDGDTLSVATASVGTFTTTQGGSITVAADGSYTYTPPADYTGPDSFDYTVTDGTATDTGTLAITVTAVDDQPTVDAPLAANVSEEGLANGIPDTTGMSDTTNATVVNGTLSIVDPDNSSFDITLTAPTGPLTSNGVDVTWSGGAPGTPLVGSANGVEVIRVSVTNTGDYTVILSGPVDHAITGSEDVMALDIGVAVSDGVNVAATTTLMVNIEDDAPYIGSQHQAVTLPPQDTNLMIVLDISGSMSASVTVNGQTMTRLQATVNAINTLLDSYDAFGNVVVRIVTFSTGANPHGTTWETVASAKTYLNTLVPTGWTNYDAALSDAMAAFVDSGKIGGAQNVSYFLSDGSPTYSNGNINTLSDTNRTGSNNADEGIQSVEEGIWKTFLNSNSINSFAMGIGSGVTQANLNPVAWNGVTQQESNGVVITDMNTLASTLAATVAPPTTGQILSGNALGTNWGIGADGGYLESIGVDGYNYTFNPTTGGLTGTGGSYSYNSTSHVLTVNTSQGGILAVDMDNGDYIYQANDMMIGPYTEAIDVALVDHDGDQATGTLTLDAARAQGGVGNDVIVGTSASELIIGGGGSDTIDISSGGADTLRWVLGDATGSPTDTVTGFSTANDTLDLRDLLVGELHVGVDPGNLASYLSFNYAGGNTTINVTTHDASSTTQSIVLNGVDLTSNNSMTADQIIQGLLTSGKLITD